MARRNIHDIVADARNTIEELDVAQLQAEIEAGDCTVIDIRDIRERIGGRRDPGSGVGTPGHARVLVRPRKPVLQQAVYVR